MSNGVFKRVIDTSGLSKVDNRYAWVRLEGVGAIVVDKDRRTLSPMTQFDSDQVLDWAWVDAIALCKALDAFEASVSKIFGAGRWQWVVTPSSDYEMCEDCCS